MVPCLGLRPTAHIDLVLPVTARAEPGRSLGAKEAHVAHGPAGGVQPGEGLVNGGSPAMRTRERAGRRRATGKCAGGARLEAGGERPRSAARPAPESFVVPGT